MRIDWPALLQNPWFQLGGLVAVLSGGTMIFNLTSGPPATQLGNNGLPNPPPIAINTPPPPPVLKPKKRGQWIVDANGAPDADSRDLRAVVANLAEDDVVTIRPGSYEGGFRVPKSARFVGSGTNPQAAVIRTTLRDVVTVAGPRVVFVNLTVALESIGDTLQALNCVGTGRLEFERCVVSSQARLAVAVIDNGTLVARDTAFQTGGAGCAAKFTQNAHGTYAHCTFSDNRWGPEAMNAAQVQIIGSTFARHGLITGSGNTLAVQGGQARMEVSDCTFTDNRAVLLVGEGGTLNVGNSTFTGNGVTGEKGNTTDGMISAKSGAKVTLANVNFQNNKQGIVALTGASVTLTGCRLVNTGVRTDNQDISFYCNALAASGTGTSLTLNHQTAISGTAFNGIVVVEGATLLAEDTTVEGAAINGLAVGNQKGGSTVEVRRSKFSRNANAAVTLNTGSKGKLNGCEFSNQGDSGVWAGGRETLAMFTDCAFRNSGGVGLWTQDGAEAGAVKCVFDGNKWGVQAGLPNKPQQAGILSLEDCVIGNSAANGAAICAGSILTSRNLTFGKNKAGNLFLEKTAIHNRKQNTVR